MGSRDWRQKSQKLWKSLTLGRDAPTTNERAESEYVSSGYGFFRRALNLSLSLLNCVYLILRATLFVTRFLTHTSNSGRFPAELAGSSSSQRDAENTANEWKNVALPVEVLWKIFGKSDTLSPRDVLGCRAVCKTWRGAATSFLLQQKCCEVVLNYEVSGTGSGEKDPSEWRESVTFINTRQPSSSVSELTKILSSSAAFPSTSICFHTDIKDDVFGDFSVSSGIQQEEEGRRELLRLFSLHGSKFKSLALPREFSAKALQNILYEHMPNLECLDSGNLKKLFESSDDGVGDDTILRRSPSQGSHLYTKLNEIIWNLNIQVYATRQKLFIELVQISPKLSKIQNVNIPALRHLIAEKKPHLIHSLLFMLGILKIEVVEEISNLIKNPLYFLNLKGSALSHLRVDYTVNSSSDEQILIPVLNSLLEWSKDTLKYLSLEIVPVGHPGPSCKIKIPSMPKLVTLELVEVACIISWSDYGWDYSNGFGCCSIVNTYDDEEITGIYDWNLFQFEYGNSHKSSRIPHDYLPRLRKVHLERVQRDIRSWKKLIGFFALDRLGEVYEGEPASVIVGDRVLSVTELEMQCFVLGSDKLSKLFPNISSITITFPCKLRNSVWTTFPHLKKFEIFEDPEHTKKSTSDIDSFFTGIPENLCVSFASEKPAKGLGLSSAQVQLFRTEPYIGNCYNLAEFKINFKTRLEHTFASKLSALYGLRELGAQTRYLFLFNSLKLNPADVADMMNFLSPLSPYVQIET